MSNHFLENNPVNEKVCVGPVAKRPDKLEKATRTLISPRGFTLFSSNGKRDER